jgi:hypothetical protein
MITRKNYNFSFEYRGRKFGPFVVRTWLYNEMLRFDLGEAADTHPIYDFFRTWGSSVVDPKLPIDIDQAVLCTNDERFMLYNACLQELHFMEWDESGTSYPTVEIKCSGTLGYALDL